MKRINSITIAILLMPALLCAEAPPDDGQGLWFSERMQGTSNAAGLVLKANSVLGYSFNGHVQVYSGLPVYFTRQSSSNTSTSNATSSGTPSFVNGIGNAFAGLLISASNDSLKYTSDLVLAAPTGNRANGFSTGHASVDWTNSFSHSFDAVTPFLSVGLANTISDTAFFVRPFTTNGAVAHFEGGGIFKIAPHLSVAASAYAVQAAGQQEIVSKVLGKSASQSTPTTSTTTSSSATKNGTGTTSTVTQNVTSTGNGHNNVFQTTQQTLTTADAADDHGFSTWLSLKVNATTDFQIGYSRSMAYQLDSLFFGLGFRVGH